MGSDRVRFEFFSITLDKVIRSDQRLSALLVRERKGEGRDVIEVERVRWQEGKTEITS